MPAHFYRATFSMQSSFFPLCAQLTFVLELFPGREESNQAFADSNVTVRLDTTTQNGPAVVDGSLQKGTHSPV